MFDNYYNDVTSRIIIAYKFPLMTHVPAADAELGHGCGDPLLGGGVLCRGGHAREGGAQQTREYKHECTWVFRRMSHITRYVYATV